MTRALAVAGCSTFVVIMVTLHFLRGDLSPVERGMSRYAGGDTLALASVAFGALAVGLLSCAAALRRSAPGAARSLVVGAAGLILVVLTPIGDQSVARFVEGFHTIGGLAFYVGIARAMSLLMTDRIDKWLGGAMFATLSLFVLSGVGVPGLRPFTGLLQRAVFLVAIAWITAVALRPRAGTTTIVLFVVAGLAGADDVLALHRTVTAAGQVALTSPHRCSHRSRSSMGHQSAKLTSWRPASAGPQRA